MSANTHHFRSLAFCLVVLPTFCITAEQMEQLPREGEQAQAISFLSLENCTGYCLFHQGRNFQPFCICGIPGRKEHSHEVFAEQIAASLGW